MTDEAERGRLKAAEWLRSLLRRGERAEADQVKRTVTATPGELAAYKQSLEPAFRRAIHESLSTQRLAPAIEIVWARGQVGHELRTVRLRDLALLRTYLGAATSTDVAAKARRLAIESATRTGGLDPQLAAIIDRMHHEWVRNQPAYRMIPDAPDQIEVVLRTVAAVVAGEHKGLDMRSFSVRVHGNTKAVEAHHGIIERILSELYEGEGAATFDLERYIGLEKTPQPFCLGGRLEFVQSDLTRSQSSHYVGLPRNKVVGGSITSPVHGFLIVENWTTFEKAAAVAPDHWVALFCAGFPSPGWVDAAVGLIKQFPTAELRHWGDLDMGGFRIFEHLARLFLPRQLQPQMMNPKAYAGVGKPRPATDVEASELIRISRRLPMLSESIREILDSGIFCLEQEAILPPSGWGLSNAACETASHAEIALHSPLHRCEK